MHARTAARQVYAPNDRFPKGGKMSQLLDSLDIGDTIDIKGPVGEIVYLEPGQFLIRGKPRNASKLAMLAGGTGITPMYQVIKAVLSDPADKSVCSLIYANQTEEDILLKGEVCTGCVLKYCACCFMCVGWSLVDLRSFFSCSRWIR